MSVPYGSSLGERDFQGVGGNPVTSLGQLSLGHDSRVDAATQRSITPYTAASNMENPPYMGVPRTADTLAFSRRGDMQLLMQLMQVHEESFDGWWFQFAQRNRTDQMKQFVKILITDPYLMERSAELTAPNLIQFKEESYAITMQRYKQGFDIYDENFMTPEGQNELTLKVHMFLQNAMLTQKLLIMSAAIDAEEIMYRQYRRMTKFRSLEHFTKHDRMLFGAATKDPFAMQKLLSFLDIALSRSPRKPNINMAVLAKKVFHQLRFGNQRNLEYFRAGPDVSRAVNGTSQEYANGLLPFPLYADEKVDPVNSESGMPIEALRRQATVGQYVILQNDDDGPTVAGSYGSKSSYREPTIQKYTADVNDFTNFSMREALEHDVRFAKDGDGTIFEFTQRLIDNETSMRHPDRRGNYGKGQHVEDMFVYEPKIVNARGRNPSDVLPRVCEMIGEMRTDYLPHPWTSKQARRAAANVDLTQEESEQLGLLLEAADSIYNTPHTGAMLAFMFTRCQTDVNGVKPEPLWGGPLLNPEYKDPAEFPYGCGSIFKLMSIMAQVDLKTAFPTWKYSKLLRYGVCRSALEKVARYQKRAFYKCGLNDGNVLPAESQTGNVERDNMIAALRGPFERVKHGAWVETTAADMFARTGRTAVAFPGLDPAFAGYLSTATAVSAPYIFRLFDESDPLRNQVQQTLGKDNFAGVVQEINRMFTLHGSEDTYVRRVAHIVTMNNVISLLSKGTKVPDDAVKKMFEASLSWSSIEQETTRPTTTRGGEVAGAKNVKFTRLTVAKEHWGPDGSLKFESDDVNRSYRFLATNARTVIDTPVPVAGNNTTKSTLARARFGVDTSVEDVEQTFPDNNRQHMDARRVNVPGGPFLAIHEYLEGDSNTPNDVWLFERQYMSERATMIQREFEDDHSLENALCRYFAYSFIFTPINRKAFLTLMENNLHVPMNYMFAWHSIRLYTQALMLAEGGANTCRLNYNWVHTTVPHDGVHKTKLYHMTAWMGAKVIDPSKVIIIPDFAYDGYLGGLGKKFITSPNFMDDGDVFVFGLPVTFTRENSFSQQHNPIPLFGMHDREFYNGMFDDRDAIFGRKPHFPTWSGYNIYFGHFGNKVNATATKPLFTSFRELRGCRWNPGTLWHARTRTYNPQTGQFDYQRGTKGTGHLDACDPEKVDVRAMLDGEVEFKDGFQLGN